MDEKIFRIINFNYIFKLFINFSPCNIFHFFKNGLVIKTHYHIRCMGTHRCH